MEALIHTEVSTSKTFWNYIFNRDRRTLESLDDKGGSGGNDGDGGLTVLDGQLDGDTETLPVTSGLGDIFTDLFG